MRAWIRTWRVARRPVSEAVKVFLLVLALGPPIGGIVVMTGLQIFQWAAVRSSEPLTQSLATLGKSLIVAVPLSYYVGGFAAGIAGLALATYISWGFRFTLWACLAAALIYPLGFALRGYLIAPPETVAAVLIYASIVAAGSVASALICYVLLRNTALVRRINADAGA